jgi:hypothetical protein
LFCFIAYFLELDQAIEAACSFWAMHVAARTAYALVAESI